MASSVKCVNCINCVNCGLDSDEDTFIKKVIETTRADGNSVVVIVRTKPCETKPGMWYFKGYMNRSYEELYANLNANIGLGKLERKGWVIRLT
jgi:hypothetical protein